ncbi:hypothetical protein WJX81_005222 [Elliptochloris bilobata]|uniref:Nucleotide-diphospho-sugar transferase domain-containing protein n=1 Tax=Elliptochloris bilobata TaxID=381761 RepID=A0AAW1R0U6_9CHLO
MVHLLSVLPHSTAFLSLYESGSSDSSGEWLELLRALTIALDVPHRIVVAWPAERTVFLNDVFFCAHEVVRLLQHDADIDSALLGFYDIWVARDTNGSLFLKEAPYVAEPSALQRISLGLPFPVRCCWNGLVVLNTSPFLHHGTRVRGHKEGECAASECSLLCNDFLRLGFRRMLVDPGVRQAYNQRDAADAYKATYVPGIPHTIWADVAAAPSIDWQAAPLRAHYQCCGLPAGHDMVDFGKDCAWDSYAPAAHNRTGILAWRDP